MKNPYMVLGINQDATNKEIILGQATAMKKREYSLREIAAARATLSKPATRLATDYTFPIFPPLKHCEEIKTTVKSKGLQISSINPNKYDSL